MGAAPEEKEYWLKQIELCLEELEFGSIQIVVHDGRIVQIERTERKRFDAEPRHGGSSGGGNGRKARSPETSD